MIEEEQFQSTIGSVKNSLTMKELGIIVTWLEHLEAQLIRVLTSVVKSSIYEKHSWNIWRFKGYDSH